MNLYGDELLNKSVAAIQEVLRRQAQEEPLNLPQLLLLEEAGKKRSTLIRWLTAVQNDEITIEEDLVVKTDGGYPLDEVISALQKDIRRGNWQQACFWAMDIIKSGNVYRLWKRLQVIAVEDVGMTVNPPAIVTILSLKNHATELGCDSWDGQRAAIAGAFFLATSPKSRLMDDLTSFYTYLHDGKIRAAKPVIPAYAQDQHTKAGRQGKTKAELVKQWYEEASILDRPVRLVKDEEKILKAIQEADGYLKPKEAKNGKEGSPVSQGLNEGAVNGESVIRPAKVLRSAGLRGLQGVRRLWSLGRERVASLVKRSHG